MACPHFRPTEPLPHSSSPRLEMLPLGGAWAGTCHASLDPAPADERTLMPFCNLGYARGMCSRFAADPGPDAVRFTIAAHDGDLVRLYYVFERDHRPDSHGPLEFDAARQVFTNREAGETLLAQARAYLSIYLRRKAESFVR